MAGARSMARRVGRHGKQGGARRPHPQAAPAPAPARRGVGGGVGGFLIMLLGLGTTFPETRALGARGSWTPSAPTAAATAPRAPASSLAAAVLVNARRYRSLQAALHALPARGGTALLPCGTYRFGRPLVVRTGRRATLRGVSRDCVVLEFTQPTGNAIDVLAPAADVVLEEFTLRGSPKAQSGILIHLAADRSTVRRVRLTGGAQGIQADAGAADVRIEEVDVTCTEGATDAFRFGAVAVDGCAGVGCGRSTETLRPVIRDVRVTDCGAATNIGQVFVRRATDAVVEGCTVTNSGTAGVASQGIWLSGVVRARLVNNAVTGHRGVVESGSDAIVTNADGTGRHTSLAVVMGNQATGGTNEGLDVFQCDDCVVIGNTATGNGNVGIELHTTPRVVLAGNVSASNADDGIRVTAAPGCVVQGNTSSGNGRNGIVLNDGSTCMVTGNNAIGNATSQIVDASGAVAAIGWNKTQAGDPKLVAPPSIAPFADVFAFNRMRSPPACQSETEGEVYFDTSLSRLCVCGQRTVAGPGVFRWCPVDAPFSCPGGDATGCAASPAHIIRVR